MTEKGYLVFVFYVGGFSTIVLVLNWCAYFIEYEELALGCHNHFSIVLSPIFIPAINPQLPKTSVQLKDIKHQKMPGHGKSVN